MKKILFVFIICIGLFACASRPKGFTYFFDGEYTGLDTLININGYYRASEKCDSSNYIIFMFYPNGLITLATISTDTNSDIITCFAGDKSIYSQYPSWGTYRIVNDTIKTQIYQDNGNWGKSYIWFRDFLIKLPTEIVLIKNYCIINGCNQDSVYVCPKASDFSPLERKRDWKESPLLKKKWFTKKPN